MGAAVHTAWEQTSRIDVYVAVPLCFAIRYSLSFLNPCKNSATIISLLLPYDRLIHSLKYLYEAHQILYFLLENPLPLLIGLACNSKSALPIHFSIISSTAFWIQYVWFSKVAKPAKTLYFTSGSEVTPESSAYSKYKVNISFLRFNFPPCGSYIQYFIPIFSSNLPHSLLLSKTTNRINR